MINRENGLIEVENRLLPLMGTYPLVYFQRSPARTVGVDDMPCLLILEQDDEIIKRTSRTNIGYPVYRTLEVIVEVWDLESGDVRDLRDQVVGLLFVNDGVLSEGTIVRETKTLGPFNLGIPDVLGMRLVCNMSYQDEGPI